MGRRKIHADDRMMLRLALGTLKRIEGLKLAGETITDFIRQAVERELKRRERSKKGGGQ